MIEPTRAPRLTELGRYKKRRFRLLSPVQGFSQQQGTFLEYPYGLLAERNSDS